MSRLAELIAAKKAASSASLESPSDSPAVAGGESSAVDPAQGPGPSVPGGDLREGLSSEDEKGSQAAPSPAASSTEMDSGESSLATEDEPYGVATSVAPGGIEIYFQAGPERLYRVRDLGDNEDVDFDDPDFPWKDVPYSISGVCDILEKGGLPWWGMRIGVRGLTTLVENSLVVFEDTTNHPYLTERAVNSLNERRAKKKKDRLLVDDWARPATEDLLLELLTAERLTVNHVRDEASDRGTNVHTALQLWAEEGILPQPEVYAQEEQGYVIGLREFLIDSGAEAVASEVMVGSVKHKLAGRYDLDAQIPNNAEIAVKLFEKKSSVRARFPGGLYRLDLKTSKDVYDTHFIQLEGYEECAVEGGYAPSDYRGVIHVTADGKYELRLNLQHYSWNHADKEKRYLPRFEDGKRLVTFTDLKHVLATAKALDRIKGRSK